MLLLLFSQIFYSDKGTLMFKMFVSVLLLLLFTGCGVEPEKPAIPVVRDPVITDGKAFLNFNECNAGSGAACYRLGWQYLNGDGMPQSRDDKAKTYFWKSCELQYREGCQMVLDMAGIRDDTPESLYEKWTGKKADFKPIATEKSKTEPKSEKKTEDLKCGNWKNGSYALNVSFCDRSADLCNQKQDEKTIKDFASCLKKKNVAVKIQSHMDFGMDDNKTISPKRAGLIKDKLIKYGVNKDLLIAAGYGDSNPITNARAAKGRSPNDRIIVMELPPMKNDQPSTINHNSRTKTNQPSKAVKEEITVPVEKGNANDILVPVDKSNPSTLAGYYELKSTDKKPLLRGPYYLLELLPNGTVTHYDQSMHDNKAEEWKGVHWYYDKGKGAIFIDFDRTLFEPYVKCKAYLTSNRMQMTCSNRNPNRKATIFPMIDDEVLLNKISLRHYECRKRQTNGLDPKDRPGSCDEFSESTIRRVELRDPGGFLGGYYVPARLGTITK